MTMMMMMMMMMVIIIIVIIIVNIIVCVCSMVRCNVAKWLGRKSIPSCCDSGLDSYSARQSAE